MRFMLALAVVLVTAAGASAQAPTLEQPSLSAGAADSGARIELGQLQQLSAQVINGSLLDYQGIRAKVEAANPGQTIDAQYRVVDKPGEPQ